MNGKHPDQRRRYIPHQTLIATALEQIYTLDRYLVTDTIVIVILTTKDFSNKRDRLYVVECGSGGGTILLQSRLFRAH